MNNKNELGIGGIVVGTLAGLSFMVIAMFLLAFIHGWAISMLWGWFIVPITDMPMLSYAEAYGIGLLASVLTSKSNYIKKSQEEVFTDAFMQLGLPLLAVFFGWIVVSFFM